MFSSPAVANGVVYVGSSSNKLHAFDAAGSANCSGSPTTCAPLWSSAATGGIVFSSPAVANAMVHVGSVGGKLHAFKLSLAAVLAALWSGPPPVGAIVGTAGHEVVPGTRATT